MTLKTAGIILAIMSIAFLFYFSLEGIYTTFFGGC